MYIAINLRLFRVYPVRALQFAIRKNTLVDILKAVCSLDEYQDYTIVYIP